MPLLTSARIRAMFSTRNAAPDSRISAAAERICALLAIPVHQIMRSLALISYYGTGSTASSFEVCRQDSRGAPHGIPND